MTTTTGSYNNPTIVVLPPGASLSSEDQDVRIYYVNTDDDVAFPLNTPTGNFSAKATQLGAEMHKRGHSTLSAAKAQYAVHLDDKPADGSHFLNMKHGGKHWVFNDPGAVADYTLVRNVMAFHTQRDMNQWAPRTKFFELFVAQDSSLPLDPSNPDAYYNAVLAKVEADPQTYYDGVYINMEKIRKESHRIDIPEYTPTTPDVGAAIIQLNPGSSKYDVLNQFNPLPLTADVQIYEPKAKYFTANPTQLGPLQLWYNDQTNKSGWGYNMFLIFTNTGTSTTWDDIRSSTDYPSFATYFLMNELAKDPDGYHKSTFMYKTADKPASGQNPAVPGKMHGGPLWDKNKSYGNVILQYSQDYSSPDGWLYSISGQAPLWWGVLLQDQEFCKEVWTQWTQNSATGGVLTDTVINAYIAKKVTDLDTSGALTRNNARWQNSYNMTMADYNAQVSDLTTYITSRLTWMGSNLQTLLNTTSGFTPAS